MKQLRNWLALAVLISPMVASATRAQQSEPTPPPNLANAYLKDGQKDLARQYAEKALAMEDSHAAPLSSWSDTEERHKDIRRLIKDTLKKASETH
jgi:GTP-dependent phosphoenolpyruvate carboxykinase